MGKFRKLWKALSVRDRAVNGIIVEPLERRILLSAGSLSEFAVEPVGEIEAELVLSDRYGSARPQWSEADFIDAGDYYWYFDERIPLLRLRDHYAAFNSRDGQQYDVLAAAAGLEFDRQVSDTAAVYKVPAE